MLLHQWAWAPQSRNRPPTLRSMPPELRSMPLELPRSRNRPPTLRSMLLAPPRSRNRRPTLRSMLLALPRSRSHRCWQRVCRMLPRRSLQTRLRRCSRMRNLPLRHAVSENSPLASRIVSVLFTAQPLYSTSSLHFIDENVHALWKWPCRARYSDAPPEDLGVGRVGRGCA